MKRIILFVEGQSDLDGVRCFVRRIMTEQAAWEHVLLHADVWRVKGLSYLESNEFEHWKRFLKLAARDRDLAGVLLVLDGDSQRFQGKAFCPVYRSHKTW